MNGLQRFWATSLLALSSSVLAQQPPAEPGTAALSVALEGDRLSLACRGATLAEVLGEISRRTGIRVYFIGQGAGDRIALQFERLPLEQGIRRILGRNYTLAYAPAGTAPPRLTEIRVLSRGQAGKREQKTQPRVARQSRARKAAPASLGKMSLEALTQRALQAPQPDARIAALKALARLRRTRDTLPTFASALQDADAGVRQAALYQVRQQSMPVSLETLSAMARKDASPQLRIKAWSEIAERAEPQIAQEYLVKGLKDPDPKVKGIIERMLSGFADREIARAAIGTPRSPTP